MRDDDNEGAVPFDVMPSYEEKVAELGLLDEAEAVEAYFGVDDTGGEFISDAYLMRDRLTARQQMTLIRFEAAYNWAYAELGATFELSVLYHLVNDLLWEFEGEEPTGPPDPLRPFQFDSVSEHREYSENYEEGSDDA